MLKSGKWDVALLLWMKKEYWYLSSKSSSIWSASYFKVFGNIFRHWKNAIWYTSLHFWIYAFKAALLTTEGTTSTLYIRKSWNFFSFNFLACLISLFNNLSQYKIKTSILASFEINWFLNRCWIQITCSYTVRVFWILIPRPISSYMKVDTNVLE